VGASWDVEERLRNHKSALRRGDHHSRRLQEVWDEDGEEAFAFVIVLVCPIDDLTRLEAERIKSEPLLFNVFSSGAHNPIPPQVRDKMRAAAVQVAKDNPDLIRGRSERARQQHAEGRLGQVTWKPGQAKLNGEKMRKRNRHD
jgi:hypothetical protein